MRIVVVDGDDRRAAQLVRDLPGVEHQVTRVARGDAALARLGQAPVDALLIEADLPDRSGMTLCRQARQRDDAVWLLLLTPPDGDGQGRAALAAGADGYLVRPVAPAELHARLRAWARRMAPPPAPLLGAGAVRLDPVAQRVWRGGQELRLSQKQFRLFAYLLRHPGQTLTPAMITAAVWDAATPLRSRVIAVYIHQLRRLLGDGTPGALIQTVSGVGYRLAAAPSPPPRSSAAAVVEDDRRAFRPSP